MFILDASSSLFKSSFDKEVCMPKCFICKKHLILESSVADERGHPVHEGCYLRKLDGVEQAKKEKSVKKSLRKWLSKHKKF